MMPVDAIRVGKRIRQDMGDIEGLAANIAVVGLQQPIGVTADGWLRYGKRRLAAVMQLGWKNVPVVICP